MIRALLSLSLLVLSSPTLAAEASSADRAALQALADEADRAWNARDAQGMLGAYVDGSTLRVGVDGPELVGRQSIGAFFAAAFARREGEFRHLTAVEGVDMIDPDRALSEGKVRVEQRTAGGDWTLVREFRTVSMAVRTADGWKLRWVRAIPLS